MWTYLRTILNRAEVVIAPTLAIKNEIKRYAPHIKRFEVIPTGVDLDRFNPRLDGSEVRRRYGLEGKKVILHLGRIAWEKNIELVLRGFCILSKQEPEARLVLVGEGPAKEHLMKLAGAGGDGQGDLTRLPCHSDRHWFAATRATFGLSKFGRS